MKRKLTGKENIVVASMLFGLFFGAGNLIFPVHMGQLAGHNVWLAILGFIITGVGIPILSVSAIGVTHSDGLQTLSGKAGKWYGYLFTALLYLTIGPLFAIPRCATTSFTVGIAPMLPEGASEQIPLFIFSFIFFILVLIFSLKPGKIITWVGKIINPLFLVMLSVLVVVALIRPGAAIGDVVPDAAYESNAFLTGFFEGYNTMDAIAGLAFGIVVINAIRSLGVQDDGDVARATLKSGVLAGALMALIYVLTTIIGTQSRGLFEISENGGVALIQVAQHYLGDFGSIVLAATITLACLKTAIGLITSCGETFSKMFPGKLSYKLYAIIFCIFSFSISNAGLTELITYSVPMLMLLYPLAIVLIALAFFDKFFGGAKEVYLGTVLGALIPAVFDFLKTLPFGIDVSFVSSFLPLYDSGFGWIVPALLGFCIGLIVSRTRKAVR